MNRSLCLGAAAIGFLCLCPVAVRGQDSQYWTVQYGPVAELPGGVVVGSSRDLSATFYNPGALALTKDPSLLASVESFQATRLKATAQAPVLDFAATEVRPAPSLFSFAFPRSWTGDHTLAISTLVRQNFDLRTDNWLVSPSRHAGAETLFDRSLTESWFGLSWAHKAGDNLGVGLTTYMAYRGQRTRKEISGAEHPELAPWANGGEATLDATPPPSRVSPRGDCRGAHAPPAPKFFLGGGIRYPARCNGIRRGGGAATAWPQHTARKSNDSRARPRGSAPWNTKRQRCGSLALRDGAP